MWVGETRWGAQTRALPALPLRSAAPAGSPPRRPAFPVPRGRGLEPALRLQPPHGGQRRTNAPRRAGSAAEAFETAARSHAGGPSRRDTGRDPPRGAARGVAPARGGVFGEKRPPRACVRSSDPRGGRDFSHWSPDAALFLSVLGERVVILGPCRAFLG